MNEGTNETAEAAAAWPARPVVLVHGILGQEVFYWNFLRRRLSAGGLEVHEVSLPNLALGDLRAAAASFATRFEALGADRSLAEVDVLAHSAGGLVLRWYLKNEAGEVRAPAVRRLVTLGCPHGGTTAAALLPEVGMVGQVRTGSPFLAALDDGEPTPGPTRYTAVWTRFDGVVVPSEHARLPAAPNVENLEYPGITHWGYLFGPRLARVLAKELRAGFVGGERVLGALPSPLS